MKKVLGFGKVVSGICAEPPRAIGAGQFWGVAGSCQTSGEPCEQPTEWAGKDHCDLAGWARFPREDSIPKAWSVGRAVPVSGVLLTFHLGGPPSRCEGRQALSLSPQTTAFRAAHRAAMKTPGGAEPRWQLKQAAISVFLSWATACGGEKWRATGARKAAARPNPHLKLLQQILQAPLNTFSL